MLVIFMKKHVSVPGVSLIPWKRRPHSLPKGLETGIFHECCVFHLFPRAGVNDGVGLVLLRPMVGSQGNDHGRSVHTTEVVLGQVAWR
jgi:hypothetical protein